MINDYRGYKTPLLHALECGHAEVVQLLLSYRSDITLLGEDETSVFHYSLGGRVELRDKIVILKQLIQQACQAERPDLITASAPYYSPLSIAIEYNDAPLELVKELLPYYEGRLHQEPFLARAVIKDQFEVAELLLREGADLYQPAYGDPPLYWAVFRQNLDITKLLLEYIQDSQGLNYKDEEGATVLHIATKNQDLKIMTALLHQQGIDLHAHNNQSQTALDIALEAGYDEGVKLLLEHGAQIHLTPTSKVLSAKGTHFDKVRQRLLFLFISNRNAHSLQMLLNSSPDLDVNASNPEVGNMNAIVFAATLDGELARMLYPHASAMQERKKIKFVT